jgi:hypothetical protein
MPAMNDGAKITVAGVRKPPRNEPAGDGEGRAPRTRLGDLADTGVGEGAHCAWARAMTRLVGNGTSG